MVTRSEETLRSDAAAFFFAPDGARGHRLDAEIRSELARSLATIFEAMDDAARIDPGQAAALLSALEAGPVKPGLFGLYVDLVVALFGEREDEAAHLAAALLASAPAAPAGIRTVTLDDADLGPGQAARYARLMIDDLAFDLAPVPMTERGAAAAGLEAGLALLRTGAPDAFAELAAITREIVLVTAPPHARGLTFGGAATFSLWGAVALNVSRLESRLTAAVGLAHEAAHAHLFGLARGGLLTRNEGDERFPSPLRGDLRPMEGVAHATFVAARMAHALEALLDSGRLDAAETADAREQLAANRDACQRGLRTVLAHARFTPAGQATFDGLSQYLAEPGGGRGGC
jgi:HEXXH motif-containing protein